MRSAPLVRSLDDLARHVRHATRAAPGTAWRSVRALYERAVEAGDAELAQAASGALEALQPTAVQLQQAFGVQTARRALGLKDSQVLPGGPTLAPGGKATPATSTDDVLAQLAYELDDSAERALELAAGAARYFDVEDALGEELVEAEVQHRKPVRRVVPYPTQLLTFEQTASLDRFQDFVIDRPASIILSLASGTQLARTYLEEEPPQQPKSVKKTAVRVYVLDASGSMHGARARFRDAILVAELNAIRVKAKLGQPFDPLYFSFFNDTPTDLVRVDTGLAATRHIEQLLQASPAQGQTDIGFALMSAFDSIQNAQGRDPYLARATVVLVTDGEDAVDLELVRKTKRPFEALDIALSFIALGEENPDLKALVLEQREQGARAFYHHLADEEIALARTEFDSAWRTLLPVDVPVTPEALERLGPHLEALEAIARGRAMREPDRRADQFEALFPAPGPAGQGVDAALAGRLAELLAAVAEAASLASMDDRPAEAVALLIHLLGLYGVPVPRYLEVVLRPPEAVGEGLARVRLLCRPFRD